MFDHPAPRIQRAIPMIRVSPTHSIYFRHRPNMCGQFLGAVLWPFPEPFRILEDRALLLAGQRRPGRKAAMPESRSKLFIDGCRGDHAWMTTVSAARSPRRWKRSLDETGDQAGNSSDWQEVDHSSACCARPLDAK